MSCWGYSADGVWLSQLCSAADSVSLGSGLPAHQGMKTHVLQMKHLGWHIYKAC